MNTAATFAKRAVCAAAIALVSLGASANDILVDIGPITPGFSYNPPGFLKTVGSFTDTFTFSVTQPLFSDGVVSDFPRTAPAFSTLNITDLDVKLYLEAGAVDVPLMTLAGSADSKAGSGLFLPGSYYFTISGNAVGSAGGRYTIDVATFAAPVPEPESYAMFLAGLGVMGAIALRRNKKPS